MVQTNTDEQVGVTANGVAGSVCTIAGRWESKGSRFIVRPSMCLPLSTDLVSPFGCSAAGTADAMLRVAAAAPHAASRGRDRRTAQTDGRRATRRLRGGRSGGGSNPRRQEGAATALLHAHDTHPTQQMRE